MSKVSSIKLLTNAEVAQLLAVRPNTLEIWRTKGVGPVYRKLNRAVRYVEADVVAWIDAQTRSNTSQTESPNRPPEAIDGGLQ